MLILLFISVFSLEIAFLKFLFINYGLLLTLVAGSIFTPAATMLGVSFGSIAAAFLEFDEDTVQAVPSVALRLWRSFMQFIKSLIFANILLTVVNISFFVYTLNLDQDGKGFEVLKVVEFIATIIYAFLRARVLSKKLMPVMDTRADDLGKAA